MATFKGKWLGKYSHPMEHLGFLPGYRTDHIPFVHPGFCFSPGRHRLRLGAWKSNCRLQKESARWEVVVSVFGCRYAGSTISNLLHDKINPKDCQVLSLGDSGFLQLFRVVSSDYGKPRYVLQDGCRPY